MRAILIDPYAQTITEVEGDFDKTRNIRAQIGVDTTTTILFRKDKVICLLDDNGHLGPGKACFILKTYHPTYPLAGKMLVCGLRGPATVSLGEHITVAAVAEAVVWTDQESTGAFTQAGPVEGGYDMGQPVTRKRSA